MSTLDRRARFAAKYSAATDGAKKEINVMGRRGPGGMMRGGGKPKNTLKTLKRLLAYLSHERKLLIGALVAALVIIFAFGEDPAKKDSDGDGIPDIYDEEVDDSLEGDNRVDIGDFFG